MQQDNQLPAANTQTNHWRVFVLIVTILVLGFGGAWLITHRPAAVPPLPYQQKYSRLTQYKLTGPAPGTGVVFQKPAEFDSGTVSNSAGVTSQVSFVQRPTALVSDPTGVGQVILLSYIDPSIVSAATFGQSIMNTANPAHKAALGRLETFVNNRLPGYQPAVMAQPAALNTPNLKNDAWMVAFSALPKPTAAGTKNKSPTLKGQAAIIVSPHSTYYLMVDAIDYNWTANAQFWQQVINSIKVDQ